MTVPTGESFPTTVLERYLLRPSHGPEMVFSITLMLRGELQVAALEQAWSETLRDHPRLFAHLVGRGRSLRWQLRATAGVDSFVFIQAGGDAGDTSRDNPLDAPTLAEDRTTVHPRSGCGARCVVQRHEQNRWSVRILFHHGGIDGVGAIRFFGQLAKSYADVASRVPRVPRRREHIEVAAEAAARHTESAAASAMPDLRNVWTTVRGSNVRLSRHGTASLPLDPRQLESDRPDCVETIDRVPNGWRLVFTRTFSDRLRQSLRANDLKLNDWSLAVTIHTLAERTAASASARRHIMLMNPVETRSWAQRHETRNHIGIAFIRRTHQQLEDFQQTLQSLSGQMNSVRQYGTASEMTVGISLAERIPGCLSVIERIGTFCPTAALTCLAGLRLGRRFGVDRRDGRLWIANVELADVFFEAPVQAGGELSLAIWEFDGRLAVSIRTANDAVKWGETEQLPTHWSRIAERSFYPEGIGSH